MLLCPLKFGIEDLISMHIFVPSLSSDVQLTHSKTSLMQVSHTLRICLFGRFLTFIFDIKPDQYLRFNYE